jgi:hypothetical protein
MTEAVEKAACRCKKFSNEEFLTGLAMLIGAAEFSQKGIELFTNKDQSVDDDPNNDQWRSISQSPKFEQYMAFSRFKDFRHFLPAMHADESRKDTDPYGISFRVQLMNSTSSGTPELNVGHGFVLMKVCLLGDLGQQL